MAHVHNGSSSCTVFDSPRQVQAMAWGLHHGGKCNVSAHYTADMMHLQATQANLGVACRTSF